MPESGQLFSQAPTSTRSSSGSNHPPNISLHHFWKSDFGGDIYSKLAMFSEMLIRIPSKSKINK